MNARYLVAVLALVSGAATAADSTQVLGRCVSALTDAQALNEQLLGQAQTMLRTLHEANNGLDHAVIAVRDSQKNTEALIEVAKRWHDLYCATEEGKHNEGCLQRWPVLIQ